MKKVALLVVALFAMSLNTKAINDKPITVNEMPQAAQTFIQTHFANHSVAMAKVESEILNKSYDVIFTNGDKIEFDKKGNWTNIDCEHTQVPLNVIPAEIRNFLTTNYSGVKLLQIEKNDRKGYDVDLSNGIELEFDKRFRVVDMD
ncbi:MAG: PepSY-like domain-containing protein [Bacteroides sp.]|nr:PepSY-like domain-containing protein [Bacteroides sp.]